MQDELISVLKEREFRKDTRQEALTEALNWCRDNNEHGEIMPGQYAADLLKAGILFWDPDHEMYDIIEPIKSWLEPHKVEPNHSSMADKVAAARRAQNHCFARTDQVPAEIRAKIDEAEIRANALGEDLYPEDGDLK